MTELNYKDNYFDVIVDIFSRATLIIMKESSSCIMFQKKIKRRNFFFHIFSKKKSLIFKSKYRKKLIIKIQ